MSNDEKLIQLFQDDGFKKEAETVTTAEEMQALFSRHGVEYTLEEVYTLCESIAKNMEAEKDNEELSEGSLDNVSGGSITIGLVALGVACVGAAALGIYNGYKSTKPAHT